LLASALTGVASGWVATICVSHAFGGEAPPRPSAPLPRHAPLTVAYIDPAGNDATGDGSSASPFLTPQRAVDAVDPGGTVWVRPGAYPYRATIDKRLRFAATAPGSAILGPTSLPGAVLAVVGADDVAIEGLTFAGAADTRAIHANSGADRLHVADCRFSGFGSGCILIDGPTTSGHAITACRFLGNRGVAATAAVTLAAALQARLTDCEFVGVDRGVELVGASQAVVADVTFTDLFQSAIIVSGATDVLITDVHMTRCGHFATPRSWNSPGDARGAISIVSFSNRAVVRRAVVEDCGGYTGKNTYVGSELFRYDGMFGIGVVDSANVVIEDSAFHRNWFGGVHVTGASSGITLQRCDFVANGERNDPGKDTALYTGGLAVVATDNYWGLPSGPNHDGAGSGNGIDGGGSVSLAPIADRPRVFAGAGFAALPEVVTGRRPLALHTADVDADGRLDAVCCEDQDGTVSVVRNQGGGFFGARQTLVVGGRPVAVASGRFDADAILDLVVLDDAGDRAVLLRGNGDGTFVIAGSTALPRRPVALRVADLDGANGPDVAIACEGDVFRAGAVTWLRNNGSGGFTRSDLPGAAQPTDVELLDLNADLRLEIVAFERAAPNPGLRQYANLGAGVFGAPVAVALDAAPVFAASLQRINVDGGADDLVVASYRFDVPPGRTSIRLLRGTGSGTLAPPVLLHEDLGPVFVRAGSFVTPSRQSVVVVNPGLATVAVIGPVAAAPTPFSAYAIRVQSTQYAADAAVGDVTEDGQADLLVADGGRERIVVLRSESPFSFTTFGTACAGTPGLPSARAQSLPKIGAQTFAIACERGLANALCVAMLGATQLAAPLPGGCFLYVDPLIQLFTVTDVTGFAAIGLPIPPETRLIGLDLVGQWFVIDAGGQILNLVSASEGFRFIVGG
jgi:hypothetical protein